MLRLSAIPVLAGPTASGKTAMALQLAQAFPLEVISADASMVYRGMDIGTAKPSPAEQAQLPHHLLDVVEPDQPFSVSDYLAQAQQSIAQVLAHGRIPLVVGGTGYYIRALSEGLFQVPEPDPALQEEIWAELNAKGIDALEAELYRASPADVLRVERNPRRLVRAIEVLRRSGAPPVRAEKIEPAYRYSKLIFWPQWEWLEPRLKARIEAMFAQGLVAEVERLLHRYPTMPTAFQAIGYKEVAAHLRGGCSLDQAKALVLKATRAYAKRQFTWFRKEPGTVRRLETNQDVLVQAKEWLYQLQVDIQP
jgi:tRNA dimethylallyltransferase